MGLGVERARRVALRGDLGQRGLALFRAQAVLGEIARGHHGERAGSRHVGEDEPVARAHGSPEIGEPAVACVLQLLHAHRQRDVAGAGSNGVACCAESLGAARAEVLHAADRDEGELQRDGKRQRALAHVDLLETGGKPRRLYLLLLDTGVGQGLDERVHNQVVRALVPQLAKAGAAHPNDRHFIPDSLGHFIRPPRWNFSPLPARPSRSSRESRVPCRCTSCGSSVPWASRPGRPPRCSP